MIQVKGHMLVLLGPSFGGNNDEYVRLAQATGMVPYDLRTRLKPGQWGVVKVLADVTQAEGLGERLRTAGFQTAILDPVLGHDTDRPVVAVSALTFTEDQVVITLREREITVPFGALLVLVRGEVRTGSPGARSAGKSSATLRAVVPSASEMAALRASQGGQFDAFPVLDLHFITVTWIARVDARRFDFGPHGDEGQSKVQALDALAARMSDRAAIRVDRGSRVSSLASFCGLGPARPDTPVPGSVRSGGQPPQDDQFDAYSRLVAEAERQTRRFVRRGRSD